MNDKQENPQKCPRDRGPTSDSSLCQNHMLVSDDSGLYLTPDNERLGSIRLTILSEKPRLFLQSTDGSHLAVYHEDAVYLAKTSLLESSPSIEGETPLLKATRVLELGFCHEHVFVVTPTDVVGVNLSNLQKTSFRYLSQRPKTANRNELYYTVNEEAFVDSLKFRTLLGYHCFNNSLPNDDSGIDKTRVKVGDLLSDSLSAHRNALPERMILQPRNKRFERNNSRSIVHLTGDRLVDVSLEDRTVSFFSSHCNSMKTQDLDEEDYSGVEVSACPSGNKLLLVLTQLRFGPQKTERGVQRVFFADCQEEQVKRLSTINGPVYVTKWSHSGAYFVVVAGVAPSHVILYNCNGQPIVQFGNLSVNSVFWSLDDRCVAVGGFGTLDNELTLYRRNDQNEWLLSAKVPIRGSGSFFFFKDSQRFGMSLTSADMGTRQRYQIFDLKGECLFRTDYTNTQLYSFSEHKGSELIRHDSAVQKHIPAARAAACAQSRLRFQDRVKHRKFALARVQRSPFYRRRIHQNGQQTKRFGRSKATRNAPQKPHSLCKSDKALIYEIMQ